ncbi:MAG: HAD family hydrolase [Undibacterium sp.]|uniref:HAD family hydrolase n=1 Tax=Undibacterium sp. TaxID=1914977 RepID=UPI00271C2BD9|nr:HAD family hydrolase [Undibacterium sp.]MDO8653182.1 HAD family hydrolase [Undibacterium sp.]
MSLNRPIIALDADGVLLDYHLAYCDAWQKTFGVLPNIKDPLAYWPIDRWEVQRLTGSDLENFRKSFDHQFWSTVPAVTGAVEACLTLHHGGYELVCVSAVEKQFQAARLHNLQTLGFPVHRVIATTNSADKISPKAEALHALKPVAFVDDYLPYLRGVSSNIHSALVLREPNGSPNVGPELNNAQSQHNDLADFVDWWLNK